MQFRRFGVVFFLASALALAACSNDDSDEETADDTPVAEAVEPAPEALEEEVPAMEEEAPAMEEEAPAMEEEAPAMEEEVPAMEEEVPAMEEEAPAMEEEVQPEEAAAPDSNVIAGNAEAVESATIMIGETRVMLYGLESVYPPQICYIDGVPWECWAAAVRQLQTYLSEGPVECTPVAPPDPYGRELALCEQNGVSLNERYVRSGFAVAIEDEMPEYAAAEAAAHEEGIGLWQGTFVEPADFRASRAIIQRRP